MADIYVATTGNDTTGDGSSGNPYATVKKGYDESSGGDRVRVQPGTYTENTTIAIRNDSDPVHIFGDGGRPVLQRTSGATDMVNAVGGYSSVILDNLEFDCNSLATVGIGLLGAKFTGGLVRDCIIHGYTSQGLTIGGSTSGAKYDAVNCLVYGGGASSTAAIMLSGAGAMNCEVHSFYGAAITTSSINKFGSGAFGCLIHSPSSGSADGITILGTAGSCAIPVRHCTVHGVRYCVNYGQTAYAANALVERNIFADCTYGVYASGTLKIPSFPGVRNNAFYSTTSGQVHSEFANISPVTLSSDPFTDSANDDFSLNNTAGGGAACKGISEAFLGGNSTSYFDLGAVQSQASGGGGGVTRRLAKVVGA